MTRRSGARLSNRPLGVNEFVLLVWLGPLVMVLLLLLHPNPSRPGREAIAIVMLATSSGLLLVTPIPGDVYDKGVTTEFSLARMLRGRRRWIPLEEVVAIWPRVRMLGGERHTIGYEISYPGGQGFIASEASIMGRHDGVLDGLRTMLRERWGKTYGSVPRIDGRGLAEFARLLSRPRPGFGPREVGFIAVSMVAVLIGAYVASIPYFRFGTFEDPWKFGLAVLGVLIIGIGAYPVSRIAKEEERWYQAFHTYLLLRDFQESSGRTVLPRFPVHPDVEDLWYTNRR